jgi:hypothetical protein
VPHSSCSLHLPDLVQREACLYTSSQPRPPFLGIVWCVCVCEATRLHRCVSEYVRCDDSRTARTTAYVQQVKSRIALCLCLSVLLQASKASSSRPTVSCLPMGCQ